MTTTKKTITEETDILFYGSTGTGREVHETFTAAATATYDEDGELMETQVDDPKALWDAIDARAAELAASWGEAVHVHEDETPKSDDYLVEPPAVPLPADLAEWLADNAMECPPEHAETAIRVWEAASEDGYLQAADMVAILPGHPTMHSAKTLRDALFLAGCKIEG